MLSIKNVFNSTATERHKLFYAVEEGDLVTMLNIFNAFEENGMSQNWCIRNGINFKAMQRVSYLCQQLQNYMKRFDIPILACENPVTILKCIASTFSFSHLAVLNDGFIGNYRMYQKNADGRDLFIHPNFCLFKKRPEYIIFIKASASTKTFLQFNSVVELEWIVEKKKL